MPVILPSDNDILYHLAFDKSAQPNIISIISSGKIISANAAACKLLGYSKKELLTRDRSAIFEINDSRFKKMFKERSTEGKSVATINTIRKTGRKISCEITSAVFTGKHGIKKSITTIANLTDSIQKQKVIDTKNRKIAADLEKTVAADIAGAIQKQKTIDKVNKELVEANIKIASAASAAANNAWIKYIARTSYDVMWDWNIVSGNLYIGDSMEEVFGYKIKNNNIPFSEFKKAIPAGEGGKVLCKLMKVLGPGAGRIPSP